MSIVLNKPFWAVEGLDGSGKTTLAKIIESRLRAAYFKTPPDSLKPVRERVDKSFGPMSRFLFYFASVAKVSEEIALRLRHQPVICDRFILSTVCCHIAAGHDPAFALQCEASPFLLKPDVTFLIVCDEKKRKVRLARRGMTSNDMAQAEGDRDQKLLAVLRSRNVVEIDNSSDNQYDAMNAILKVIGR